MRRYLLVAGLVVCLINKGFAQEDNELFQDNDEEIEALEEEDVEELEDEEIEELDEEERQALEIPERRNTVKFNTLSPFVSSISGFYERGITTNMSAQIGLFYTGYSLTGSSWRGYGITPEFRYYLTSEETYNEGLYVAPFFRYQQLEVTRHIQEANISSLMNTFGGGVVGGYQFKIADRFALDAFLGPAIDIGTFRYEEGMENVEFDGGPFSGFNLRVGLSVGYSF
ncbi:DUF3575 domain-containing protein [Cytophagaceae bacterium ABcell3]|nr:DUF3575 domain-containing protein [Cytophagaceae bacterium ABcell3]